MLITLMLLLNVVTYVLCAFLQDCSRENSPVTLDRPCHKQIVHTTLQINNKGSPTLDSTGRLLLIRLGVSGERAALSGYEYVWSVLIKDTVTLEVQKTVKMILGATISHHPSDFVCGVPVPIGFECYIFQVQAVLQIAPHNTVLGAAWETNDSGTTWRHRESQAE